MITIEMLRDVYGVWPQYSADRYRYESAIFALLEDDLPRAITTLREIDAQPVRDLLISWGHLTDDATTLRSIELPHRSGAAL